MLIMKNDSFDFMDVDPGNLVIFDPDVGDTHFIEEIGIDILNQIDGETDIDDLINSLSTIYDVDIEVIKKDVYDFINELIDKKVIIQL
ncbi:MAG: hypothetical protein A2Y17_00695 [Clostridiales bacterium GWF2_38_85]|nr:MAG: hypothetical protein A2Y17_00695 [Clostridiales bacterium GWF2_38_85]